MKLSIIIPTFNHEQVIVPLIEHLNTNDTDGHIYEIIVVDAMSQDQTVAMAEKAGAKVFLSQQNNNSIQLNAGAMNATGDYLHFVHVDSYPPEHFTRYIYDQVTDGNRCGCFRSRFNTSNQLLKCWSYLTRFKGLMFRSSAQTIWVERRLFNHTGGYGQDLSLMEEYDLICKLNQVSRFNVIQKDTVVSTQKYQSNGHIRLQAINALIFIMYYLGFPQYLLNSFHRKYIH